MACYELGNKTLDNLPSEVREDIRYTIQSHYDTTISFIEKLLNCNNIKALSYTVFPGPGGPVATALHHATIKGRTVLDLYWILCDLKLDIAHLIIDHQDEILRGSPQTACKLYHPAIFGSDASPAENSESVCCGRSVNCFIEAGPHGANDYAPNQSHRHANQDRHDEYYQNLCPRCGNNRDEYPDVSNKTQIALINDEEDQTFPFELNKSVGPTGISRSNSCPSGGRPIHSGPRSPGPSYLQPSDHRSSPASISTAKDNGTKRRTSRPRVFLTFSNDSNMHIKNISKLIAMLQVEGIAIKLDMWGSALQKCMESYRIPKPDDLLKKYYKKANFVILCISPKYFRDTKEAQSSDAGAIASLRDLHTRMIYNFIAEEYRSNTTSGNRFISVLFPESGATNDQVPMIMQSVPCYEFPYTIPELTRELKATPNIDQR